jgi:hypothetical protein
MEQSRNTCSIPLYRDTELLQAKAKSCIQNNRSLARICHQMQLMPNLMPSKD